MQQMMRAVTKRVRVVRVMVTTMRVAFDEEGDGDGGKSDGNKGVVQRRGRWRRRQERWQQGWQAQRRRGWRATKRASARAARAMTTAMRVDGDGHSG
jgi:hypothetical protein